MAITSSNTRNKKTSHEAPRLTKAIASKVRWVNPVQPSNAHSLIVVRLLGRVILVNPVQPSNAPPLMVVRLFGRVMLVRPVQPLNA